MGKLWQKTVNDAGKSELIDVNLETLQITEPTIVYLSGFLTNNNRPNYVAGSIKSVQELLSGRPELPNVPMVYGWSHTGLRNLFNLAAYNTNPSSRSSDAGYDIGSGVLMPLVAKDFSRSKDGTVSGTPLSLEEAKKNLKNVTLFGYSAGAIVAQETYNATLKMMKGVGYDDKDARAVLSEVVLVAAGVFSRYTKEHNRFTTVYLVATNDRMMRAKNWIWGTFGTLLRTVFKPFAQKQQDLSIRRLSETSIIVSAPVSAKLHEWKYDDEGQRTEKKPISPLYPKWSLRRSYHELPHYVTTDENHNSFANIALYSLLNAVNRTGRIEPMKLLEAASPSAEYSQKIAKAARFGN
jgi:hypothetical protein